MIRSYCSRTDGTHLHHVRVSILGPMSLLRHAGSHRQGHRGGSKLTLTLGANPDLNFTQVAAAEANEKASYFEAEMERLNAEVWAID